MPPFPGDTVTVAGAVLIPLAGWPWLAVFAATIGGSLAGAAFDWWVGRWIEGHERRDTWLHRWLDREKVKRRVEKLKERFRRHGSLYILLNRFLPAFRSLFFVTAGMAGLKLWKVLTFAALSAAAWNGLLLAAGYAVGHNLERLSGWLDTYSRGMWIALGVGVVLWFGIKYLRRSRRGEEGDDLDP